MNYICPYCNEDLNEWFDRQKISPYGDTFDCPNCGGYIQTEYDEIWDGQEEYNTYSLKKGDQNFTQR